MARNTSSIAARWTCRSTSIACPAVRRSTSTSSRAPRARAPRASRLRTRRRSNHHLRKTSNGPSSDGPFGIFSASLALGAELLEVEVALDQAERAVVDLAPIPQLDDRSALGTDDAALDLLVLEALLAPLGGLVRVLRREVLGAVVQP